MIAEAKLFSIEEINQLIPELEEKMMRLKGKIDLYLKRHDDLFFSELVAQAEHEAGKKESPLPDIQEVQELESSIDAFETDIQAIRDLGCMIRSVEPGFVDFKGRWNDQQIYFSWKLGEKEVAYYRESNAKDAERKPLR